MEYVDGKLLKDLISDGPLDGRRGGAASSTGILTALEYSHRGGRRAPRHQARQRDGHPQRPGQGHGLRHRPGDQRLVRDRRADDRDPRHRAVLLARAGQGRDRRRRAPTSTPPGSCSSRCSPGGRRSAATPRSRSPTSTSASPPPPPSELNPTRLARAWTRSCCARSTKDQFRPLPVRGRVPRRRRGGRRPAACPVAQLPVIDSDADLFGGAVETPRGRRCGSSPSTTTST